MLCGFIMMFSGGTAEIPCGITKGHILYAEGHFPKLKARIQGSVWRGKEFTDSGIVNCWIGIKAVKTTVTVEPSWLDGQPCVVMQYGPRQIPFANVRDEVRQIEPGVWLGRAIDVKTGEVKNWFTLTSR